MLVKRILLLCALSLSYSLTASAQSVDFQSENYVYRAVTVVDGLKDPWSLAFLPNGAGDRASRPTAYIA
jgi:hypothetical protein